MESTLMMTLDYSGEEKAMAYAQLGQHLQFLRASLRRHQNGAEAFNAASLMFERAAS